MLKHFIQVLCASLLVLFLVPSAVLAQEITWQEMRTTRFAILYTSSDTASAKEYASFVDGIYDEITATFGHPVDTPVTLRLYPTLESYYQSNPLARGLTGIVAHADYRRNEVVVILPQTQSQTPDEVQNNIRHEMTHIVASDLSDNRLDVLFQEGVAQYVERPSRELEAKISLLDRALSQRQLMRWSDLDDRDTFYNQSQISYPQSLSIVAFLTERFSFATLRDMITVTARSSGYRSALERAFGTSPDTLETEWRAWLPSYIAGGYKHSALNAYDLSQAQTLLGEGRYVEAQQELQDAVTWMQNAHQTETLQQAQTLLEQSIAGQQANSFAEGARAALEAGNYADAAGLVGEAQRSYAGIGDTRQRDVLNDYAARAEQGQQATVALQQAVGLAQTWRYPQARELASQANAQFSALGDSTHTTEAQALVEHMNQRQSLAGMALLALGVLGAGASAWRRTSLREAEAW